MRTIILFSLLAIYSRSCFGQVTPGYTGDHFLGNEGIPCPWPPPSKSAISNIVLSSGTVTVTVASTAAFPTAVNQYAYITGVTDSFYNTSTSTPGVVVTVTNDTTVTYAGSGSHAASSGGYLIPANFYWQVINSTNYLCTPLGNRLFVNAITLFIPANSGSHNATTRARFASKFGSVLATSVTATLNTITTRGFNAYGDNSGGLWEFYDGSCSGACNAIPQMDVDEADIYSLDASSATFNLGPHDVLDNMQTLNSNWHTLTTLPDMQIDVFDPAYESFMSSYFANWSAFKNHIGSPYQIAMMEGSIDGWSIGTGNSPDFDTFPIDFNNADIGPIALATSPLQTYSPKTARSNTMVYPDPLNYNKALMASPPAACGLTHGKECSLATYLSKEYGTIAALNTAWGTSYTTFGSSGKCVGYSYGWCGTTAGAEIYGTGNGSTVTFAHTLANTNPDANSIQVYIAGVLVAGDCPTGRANCPTSAGNTSFNGPTISSGTCSLTTGVCTITFTTAPASSAAITIWYVSNGWGHGGTGLMDEDGTNIASNTICLFPVNGGGPGTLSYACRPGNPSSYPAPNMNVNEATDLTNWDSELVAQSEDSIHTAFKGVVPSLLLGAAEFSSNWNAPSPTWYLKGLQNYVDIIPVNLLFNETSQAIGNAYINYITSVTSLPLFNYEYMAACPDSATAGVSTYSAGPPPTCNTSFAQNTQPLRAVEYNNIITSELGSAANAVTGIQQFIGNSWWQLHDGDGTDSPENNWGLMTDSDDLYNAAEASASSVPCSAPNAAYTCGSEPAPGGSAVRPFGDLFGGSTGVTATNALWYSTSSTVATPTFNPTAGTYGVTQNVTISTTTAGATVCFTTDGSTPTEVANVCSGGTTQTYSTPVSVSVTQTLKAIGTSSGFIDSSVGAASYTIGTTLNAETGGKSKTGGVAIIQ